MKAFTFFTVLLIVLSIAPVVGQSAATYDVTFTSVWNETHHTSVPGNAHWSKLVGATHKSANTFVGIGSVASPGLKGVAELGNNTVFNGEVNTAISSGEADQYIDGPNLESATGDMMISMLEVSEDFPLLTLVSMIAPSPDWFIALNSFNLLDAEGAWKESVTMDIFAYDAGTDSGTDYTSGDMVTNPFQNILMINGPPINGNKMGTITVTLLTSTEVVGTDVLENIRIFPNPVTHGKVSISGGLKSFKKVDIFDSLGSQVKSIVGNQQQSLWDLNVEGLSEGIYILRLTTNANKTVTRKLIIK
ncbi:spondin domain-containing protein [Saccharicrinis sp. 156]|uniref:spondin domain-containing protein n=1 Tax=Saccharicrinis sp. 156 TaxID=3417574 RepID=UPI003D34AB4F